MNAINFIIQQWDSILLVILVLAIIVYAIIRGNKGIVMEMLYAAVNAAEKKFGPGTGSLKLASVIAEVYPKIPASIRAFISAEMLTKWAEDALKLAKQHWEKNQAIAEYIK